jgi:hypothetical protein
MSPARPEPLFDVKATAPKQCSRGCKAQNICAWAADKHHYGIDAKQSRTCLLRYDQASAKVPY